MGQGGAALFRSVGQLCIIAWEPRHGDSKSGEATILQKDAHITRSLISDINSYTNCVCDVATQYINVGINE